MQNINNNLILGRYQQIETAGIGGCGEVIHAYDTRLKREVAIKVIDISDAIQDGAEVDESKIPGLSEARAAGKLANSNIVTIYDCEVEDDKAYVIEEYVEGFTLSSLISAYDEYVDLDVIAHVFKSVSSAIMAAHKENILHLDIKPDNILIGRGGDVKVADFGLATLMDLNGEGSASAGTLGYMPMEQMVLEPLDVRTDEWSLAIIAYETLVGSNPFVCAKDVDDAKALMMSAELVVPSARWDELDEVADDVIFKALNVDREERYASVRQFYSALKPLLGEPRAGKKALSVLINGNEEQFLDTSTMTNIVPSKKKEKSAFLVDRIGSKGTKICSRILMAASTALLLTFVFANFRTSTTLVHGLFDLQMSVCIIAILVSCALSLFLPKYAILIPNVAIVALLIYDGAWIPAVFHAATFGLWWYFQGRNSNIAVSCYSVSNLLSAFGLSPLSIALAGAVNNVKDACILVVSLICQFLTFSCFDSKSLFTWDFITNFELPAQNSIAAQKFNENLLSMFSTPQTWFVTILWIVGTVLFALFCMNGSKALDITGALVFSTFCIASAVVKVPPTTTDVQVAFVASAVLASFVAILLAAVGFTNRIRMSSDEW